MAEYERRELQVPADSFEFTKDGNLVVNNERLTKSMREAGLEPGTDLSGEVSVGVVVSRSFWHPGSNNTKLDLNLGL